MCFAARSEPFDLTETVVTADAPHTQRDHPDFLVGTKRAPKAFTSGFRHLRYRWGQAEPGGASRSSSWRTRH